MNQENQATDTTLADVFHADQSIEATAGMAGRYFERLRASGVPKQAAVEMTLTYNAMIVAQHFGVDTSAMYSVGPEYGEM